MHRPVILAATLLALAIPSSAAATVTTTFSGPVFEGSSFFVGFQSDVAQRTGAVEVIASRDAVLDAKDAVIGTATFSDDSSYYASTQVTIDDRVTSPKGAPVQWTLFYRATPDVPLATPGTSVLVNDDDYVRQPRLGFVLSLRGSKLTSTMSFADGPAKATVVARWRGRTIGRTRVSTSKALGQTRTLSFKVSARNRAAIRRLGGTVTIALKGSSAKRDLATSAKYTFRRR